MSGAEAGRCLADPRSSTAGRPGTAQRVTPAFSCFLLRWTIEVGYRGDVRLSEVTGCRLSVTSCGFGGVDDREVDFRPADDVDQVGEHVLGHEGDDLDDLGIGITGCPNRLQIGIGRATGVFGDLARKSDGRIGLRIRRYAAAVQRDLPRTPHRIDQRCGVHQRSVTVSTIIRSFRLRNGRFPVPWMLGRTRGRPGRFRQPFPDRIRRARHPASCRRGGACVGQGARTKGGAEQVQDAAEDPAIDDHRFGSECRSGYQPTNRWRTLPL